MEKETKKLLLKHIKAGDNEPDALFDVRKILAGAGMELYAKLCCGRIKEAGLVDGIHVTCDAPPSWELHVDVLGLQLCRDILISYLQPEYMDEIQEVARKCQEYNIHINNMLYSLRKTDSSDLKGNKMEPSIYGVREDDVKDVGELYREELKQRGIFGRIRRMGSRMAFTCRMLTMFPGPLRILWPYIKKSWDYRDGVGGGTYTAERGKYAKALRRFTDAHGGTRQIGRLQGDDLVRYVYLAVKVYGKENPAEFNHVKTAKSCLEIENRYQEIKEAMEAVGRLTPIELLRMYPVEKEFDGKKWGSKDYFHTMEKLKERPMDKPIGDAKDVACLLWDYQNLDLDFLLMQWMNVLGDLKIYCNDSGPNAEFHDRLMRREKDDE